jgi:class 3 adenylate cyclase/predicted ATPase
MMKAAPLQGGGVSWLVAIMTDASDKRPEAAGARAERRHLTILFGDIVGSTTLAARLDPEDLHAIIHAVHSAMIDAIHRYDGQIAQFLGDGVLAYFGYPTAHEDAAERAVNAALQMIQAVPALSLPNAPRIQLHAGIASGLVLVSGPGGGRGTELIGEAPNLAAMLQEEAQAGQILVSAQTRSLLGGLFELADYGERPFKGSRQAVPVWRVLGRSAAQSRFDARRSAQLTEFVGREAELAVLRAEYDKAKAGRGRLVTIAGEPGIGKSRLVAALRKRLAGETFRPLLFQCSSYHTSSPWYPIIRHLEDAAGIGQGSPPSLKLQLLEALVGRLLSDERAAIVPLLAALLSIPTGGRYAPLELTPQQHKRRTIAALLALFRAEAERQPVIVLFEDLQWIDPSSLELLEQMWQSAADRRVLTILTFRPEFRPPWPDDAADAAIALKPLGPASAAAMVRSLAADRALPAAVVQQIVDKTDGVPLFIEEVAKAVLQGLAEGTGPAAAGARAAPAIPDTLQDSLMARLDRAAPMKATAQVASAIGREFALDLLEAVAPLSPEAVREAIDGLIAAGLLFRQTQRAEEVYAFKHALVQDAAYASLLRDERRRLHIQIAEALCRRFPAIAEAAPEFVAHHYTEARETAPAIEYWLRAGRQASKRSAFVEAATHFQSALDLLVQLPESAKRDAQEVELQQALASALVAAKGYGAPETALAFDRALQLCKKVPNTPAIFAVLNGLVGVSYLRDDLERSRHMAEDLLARASRQADTTFTLMGHRVLGMSLFAMGQLAEAQRHLESAIALYDPSRHAPLALVFSHDFKATAQVYLGLAHVLRGDGDGGLAQSRAAVAYAEDMRHPHTLCYVLPFAAGAYLYAGAPEAAFPLADRAVVLSTEYGFPEWAAGGTFLRGWARVELGDLEPGIADIRLGMDGSEATGNVAWMRFARLLLARALAKAGKGGEAMALTDRILAEVGATTGRWYEAEAHCLKGDLLAAAGRPAADAAACYETARSVATRQGARLFERRAELALATLSQGVT